ncbi:signal recognition particle-docking protein FtsY [Candidatus Woesearchaeota archaeon]|nr:signal recognition particle-docking protein FtsY [Candidatus Woesearchaeota archaeon]
MFEFFKKRFRKSVDKFSEEVEKEAEKEIKKEKPKKVKKPKEKEIKEKKAEKKKEERKETKEEKEKIKKEVEKKEEVKDIEQEKITEEKEPEEEEAEEKKKGFVSKFREKISTISLNEDKFEELFWELEVALLENNVAVEVVEKIKNDLKKELTEKRILRKNIEKTIERTLKESINELFEQESFDLVKKIKEKNKSNEPYIIAMIGVNGSGKTTTLAKMARMLQKEKLSVVLAASDTFRAASIEQLQKHADRLKVKMIKHDYGSDAAAVAYDAIEHARSKNIDVVLIDTAGRLHSNKNLMQELKKVINVSKPDLKLFVGESITGNDCVEQAKIFNEMVGIDAIILAKADIDEKGGAAVSISYVVKKPILYIGTGQEYDDLEEFKPEIIMENLGL